MRTPLLWLAPLLLPWLLAGCISGKSPPARTFVLEVAPPAASSAPVASARALRFRGVTAAAAVDLRQAWRLSPEELWLHELLRWVESPATTVGRGLGRELFEAQGLRRTTQLAAPALEVELRALEELRAARQVRVELGVVLLGEDGVALLEQSWTRTAPVSGDEPEDAVRAYQALLGQVLPEVADAVATALPPG